METEILTKSKVAHVQPPADTRPRARVLYHYEPQHDGDLELKPGTTIVLVDQPDGGWWEGEFNGARGIFPSNYVELI